MTGKPEIIRNEAVRWFLRLKAEPVSQALLDEFERWRGQSERHDEAFANAGRVWTLAGSIGPAVDRSAVVDFRARRSRLKFYGVALALAACLLVAIFPTLSLMVRSDYRTAVGERRDVGLNDGSHVLLDSGSAIAINYSNGARGVTLLEGRAFFEVAKDRQRPFTVGAKKVTVTVTGTAFDVGLVRDEVGVAVESGSVQVDFPVEGGARSLLLAPGDRVRIGGQMSMTADTLPVQSVAPWRRNRLILEGASISEAVDEMRRYYSGLIVVTDDGLASSRITGVYDLGDPVRALRTVVEPNKGYVRQVTPWLLIVSGS